MTTEHEPTVAEARDEVFRVANRNVLAGRIVESLTGPMDAFASAIRREQDAALARMAQLVEDYAEVATQATRTTAATIDRAETLLRSTTRDA